MRLINMYKPAVKMLDLDPEEILAALLETDSIIKNQETDELFVVPIIRTDI